MQFIDQAWQRLTDGQQQNCKTVVDWMKQPSAMFSSDDDAAHHRVLLLASVSPSNHTELHFSRKTKLTLYYTGHM